MRPGRLKDQKIKGEEDRGPRGQENNRIKDELNQNVSKEEYFFIDIKESKLNMKIQVSKMKHSNLVIFFYFIYSISTQSLINLCMISNRYLIDLYLIFPIL